jgi:hypothetical protein
MSLAVVWHFWIGVVLVLSAVGVLVAIIGGYLFKVTRSRYPTRSQQR